MMRPAPPTSPSSTTKGRAPGKRLEGGAARRNAEIMVVQEITRWRREVERFAPERLD